jgi:hypothetical protein
MTLRYIRWRNGRPRFEPSSREKALGFYGQDLKHYDGRWYTWDEAKAWSDKRYEEIVAARHAARGGVGEPRRRQWAPVYHPIGYVYFLFHGEAVKIGFSKGPLQRQRDLATAMAKEPDALFAIRAARAHETALHHELRAHHLRGEWFRRCPELLEMLHRMIDDPRSVFTVEHPKLSENPTAPKPSNN